MKIALVQCPAWGRQNPPLALAMLASALRNSGKVVYSFDLNNELFLGAKEEDKGLWQLGNEAFWQEKSKVSEFASTYAPSVDGLVAKIIQTGVDIVGFSVFSSSKEFSFLVAEKIKKAKENVKIIFGGPHCAPHMQGSEIIRHSAVDIIATGEGEETVVEIAGLLERNKALDCCKGIWFKKGGQIIENERRPLISDLDELPFADFGDFNLDSYAEPYRLSTYLSRGCINRCIYCNENLFWKNYRMRKGSRVFEEIQFQTDRHKEVRHFDFVDSLVNANLGELLVMADLIISRGLKITWGAQAIINARMTGGMLEKLKQSGCVCLAYGIESGSQKVIDLMGKGFRIEDAERLIRDTRRAGIDTVANFMFGFPGEDDEDFGQTLDFISRNKEYLSTVNPSPACTAVGAGSYLYEHAKEFRIDLSKGHLFWESVDGKNTYATRKKRYDSFCELGLALGIKFSYSPVIDTKK